MAKIWFVRRRGGQWVAPGGAPAFAEPLARIVFPLDLGVHRRLDDAADAPRPATDLPAEPPERLQRVVVEVTADDLRDRTGSGYLPGLYDSPLSPAAAAARLTALAAA